MYGHKILNTYGVWFVQENGRLLPVLENAKRNKKQ